MQLFDYHTQTLEHRAGAVPCIAETLDAAVRAGLEAICLTDHFPLPPGWTDPTPDKDCAMPLAQYSDYRAAVKKLVVNYQDKITVCQGAEVDWIDARQSWIKQQLSQQSFDYLIGSVHFVEDQLIDFSLDLWGQAAQRFGGAKGLIQAYYRSVQHLAEAQIADTVGHLDLIKKFNTGALFSEEEPWYREMVTTTLGVVRTHGMAIEINTAGWEKICADAYPSAWIIKEAFARDIPITIGSDAHVPEKIGNRLSDAVNRAKEAGYRKLVRFEKRKRVEVTL